MTGAPSLRLLTPGEAARWDAFVEACPEATFFHRSGWQRVIESAFGHRTWFFYTERNGELSGVLPLGEIRSRLFGHSLVALPFCVYGGIAASDDASRQVLAQAAHALAVKLGVGHLEYRSTMRHHEAEPDVHVKRLYYTFRKPILPDSEANMKAIPRKQRAMVRKGLAHGLRAEIDSSVDRVHAAYAHSVHRLGTPVFPKRYFALLKEVFGDACELRAITSAGELVAGVLSFYFRDEVLPYYGGGMDIARTVAGNDFMYWSLMEDAARRGCRLFDFGRSKSGTGAFDFKKNWGFEPQLLPYECKLVKARRLPDNQPLNPRYRAFISLWKRLPLGLANRVGPLIVKSLG